MVRSGKIALQKSIPTSTHRIEPSGNRCAEHERSGVRVSNCIFSRIHLPFTEWSPIPGRDFGGALRRIARAQLSPICHSAVNYAPTRKTRACESVEKCQARGWIALLTSSFIPTERGCHGEESQEGEKGEEGPQEEVVWTLLSWLGRKCPSLQVSVFKFSKSSRPGDRRGKRECAAAPPSSNCDIRSSLHGSAACGMMAAAGGRCWRRP